MKVEAHNLKIKPYFFAEFDSCKIVKIKIAKRILIINKIFEIGPIKNQKTKNKITEIIKPKIAEPKNNTAKKLVLDPNSNTEIFESNNITQIFFSKTKKTDQTENNDEKILISKFKNLKELKNFCKNINQTFETTSIKSTLHKLENKQNFVLTLSTKNDQKINLTSLLAEFNTTTEKGKFQKAIIEEHCLLIFENNAIEKTSII